MKSKLLGFTQAGIAAFVLCVASNANADANYAVDRALIEDLQARYLFALDFRDPQAYAATFTEDGVLDYGAGQIKGRKAIAEMVANIRKRDEERRAKDTSGLRPAAGRHSITNIVIKVNGDKATSVAYWHHMGNDNPERKAQLNSFGHYEDELVKVNGEWLFSKRKIYNEQVAEWAAAGGDNPVVHPGPGPRLRKPSSGS
ncbi:MAG: nuclear transport factor 2 family protein [Steroidobacteraceae bacterium]|nr:nuclear transport factor 2 family protein [Steroidobacteraceae bacterium]